ncbi:gypsy retrotransposon integrase 1 [Plakobranchus ocellatus]|uniref:Gypsy retrotransposon integrase 1 n=1 Tax=Plakobranchus ocellatus TaxID=259542 RepID=A0AAV3Y5M2_9GAST|nr:gypsy retrotransposon integrase 1 [Plakobranchus ocellatus]
MERIYYDPASTGGFGGVNKLAQQAGDPNKKALEWPQYTHTLHKPQRKKILRRKFIVAENAETKAAVVERWHRTLMFRYFTKTRQYRYLDVLQDLVNSYNSYHHSTKRSPASVNTQNQEEVWQTLYGSTETKTKIPKLKVGNFVRLARARRCFSKGYLPAWTVETFCVKVVRKTVL